jgi:peptide chain release factor 2
MSDLNQQVEEYGRRLKQIEDSFDLETKTTELTSLESQSMDPNLWNDQDNAKKVLQKLANLRDEITELSSLKEDIAALSAFAVDGELSEEFAKDVAGVRKRIEKLELTSFLSGRYDSKNAMISIHAGQGGTEAMDWSSMLFRMYVRYAERKGWSVETLDVTSGEEAGIKSVTFKVSGNYAYGLLKGEAGTHRLVRQSPFNADNLRQTSFSLVEVLPELEEMDYPDIKIKEEDLEWQFFRSGGKGGQNVNKVSTAVRVKHIPTNIVVSAQTERYQEQNRQYALNLLRAKLWALEQEKEAKEVKDIKGEYRPASWGNQIRSYVLHPYKMVKDLRSDVETSDTESVLDGDIDEFIDAELKSI